MRKLVIVGVLAAAAAVIPAIPAAAGPISPLEPYLYDTGYSWDDCTEAGAFFVDSGQTDQYMCTSTMDSEEYDLWLYADGPVD